MTGDEVRQPVEEIRSGPFEGELVPADGAEERGRVVWVGLHVRVAGAELRPEGPQIFRPESTAPPLHSSVQQGVSISFEGSFFLLPRALRPVPQHQLVCAALVSLSAGLWNCRPRRARPAPRRLP